MKKLSKTRNPYALPAKTRKSDKHISKKIKERNKKSRIKDEE